MSRRLVKRIQRKALGGTIYARIYDDGTVRVRTDHPSDDPAVEMAMAAVTIGALRASYVAHGLEAPVPGPIRWRSDPVSPSDSPSNGPDEAPDRAQDG